MYLCVWTSARWNFVYQTGDIPQRENVHKHRHCHSLSPSNSHSLSLATCQWKWTREETGKHYPWFSFLASKPWQQNRDKSLSNRRNAKLLSCASGGKTWICWLEVGLKMKSFCIFCFHSLQFISVTKAKQCAPILHLLWRNALDWAGKRAWKQSVILSLTVIPKTSLWL